MKCPICGRDMAPGGIRWVTFGSLGTKTTLRWYPQPEFEKKGLGSLIPAGGKTLGCSEFMGSKSYPGAWYCAACRKVVGVFDVEEE